MYKSGLVIVTKGFSEKNLKNIYKFAKTCIDNRLYVSVKGFSPYNGDWKHNISMCYNVANKVCPDLDVRLLLPYSNNLNDRDIAVILCDDINANYENVKPFASYVVNSMPKVLLNITGNGETLKEKPEVLESKFSSVCLGGTFDRLHNGHKILLSISALISREKLFCGVTSEELLKNKFLADLIEPLPNRINKCLAFLNDIKPGILYSVCPIDDSFGPAISNPNFDCIVGSVETKEGCEKINEIRKEQGFESLSIELIDIVDEEINEKFQNISAETKISSSKNRLKLLGCLLKPISRPYEHDKPYIIGLTGGIASGKSSIAKHLMTFGAEIIDCDKLGHEAYIPDTDCFNKIVSVFGSEIVDTDTGMINRRILGSIVFQKPHEMKKLTDIVWPAIINLANIKIKSIEEESNRINHSKRIVVIDAAVLLDAGWEQLCHEVWVSFIPRSEAIQRIKDRNNLSDNEAVSRINSQKANNFYIQSANVVFCTLWSYEFTHSQLQLAWTSLLTRLNL